MMKKLSGDNKKFMMKKLSGDNKNFMMKKLSGNNTNEDYSEAKAMMKKRIKDMLESKMQSDATNVAPVNKSEAPTYESDKRYATTEEFDSTTGKRKNKKKVSTTSISRDEFNKYD